MLLLILHLMKAQESENALEAQNYRDQLLAVWTYVAVLHWPISTWVEAVIMAGTRTDAYTCVLEGVESWASSFRCEEIASTQANISSLYMDTTTLEVRNAISQGYDSL